MPGNNARTVKIQGSFIFWWLCFWAIGDWTDKMNMYKEVNFLSKPEQERWARANRIQSGTRSQRTPGLIMSRFHLYLLLYLYLYSSAASLYIYIHQQPLFKTQLEQEQFHFYLLYSCILTYEQVPYSYTRSLGALRAPTSSLRPFGPLWLRPSRPSGAQAVWPM